MYVLSHRIGLGRTDRCNSVIGCSILAVLRRRRLSLFATNVAELTSTSARERERYSAAEAQFDDRANTGVYFNIGWPLIVSAYGQRTAAIV